MSDTQQGQDMSVNLNYCQICGKWLGMDDYDGICCECDVPFEDFPPAGNDAMLHASSEVMYGGTGMEDWGETVDYLISLAPEPEPPLPEPPDDWDEGNDDDKPHYDTPGGY